jgi:hypothetical protein
MTNQMKMSTIIDHNKYPQTDSLYNPLRTALYLDLSSNKNDNLSETRFT